MIVVADDFDIKLDKFLALPRLLKSRVKITSPLFIISSHFSLSLSKFKIFYDPGKKLSISVYSLGDIMFTSFFDLKK